MSTQKSNSVREDRILTHLEMEDLPPAGFDKITRARPNKRPIGVERKREETRRPKRDGKWS